jgi:predicted chitinase
MAVKFDISNAISGFKSLGGTTKFPDSLKSVLSYIQNDKNINSIEQAAYLLATAKAESDYSLQRWEADYVCGKAGVPYKGTPCQKAIDYYRSSSNKKNYFDLGVDDKGMAYFGRGLIQLTGKHNYEKYGNLIGVDLAKDGDKALEPKNSYRIASEYLKAKTWKYISSGDLTRARKSVNGGTNGLGEVNKEYLLWVDVFKKQVVKFKKVEKTKNQIRNRTLLYSAIGLAVIVLGASLWYATRTNKG